MTNVIRESRRLARTSFASGLLALGLALSALAFPEATLIGGMLIVGLASALFGLSYTVSALSIRTSSPHWRLLLGYGLVLLTYGMLTAGASALSFTLMLAAIAVWLVSHAALTLRMAATLAATRWARAPLYASVVLDLSIGLALIALRPLTIFQFLFFGAIYAGVFGLWQIVVGFAIRDTAFG